MVKFEYERFRVQIKLALSRITTLQQKHQNSICGRRKEVGDLLKNGQEERARLLVKYLVRDDYLSEVYEMVQMMLDDLLRSSMYIAQETVCDPSLATVVKSIIYTAGRLEVPELLRIKEMLLGKYGKDWAELALTGADQKLVVKLSIRNPDSALVSKYLQAIADCYGIPYNAVEEEEEEQPAQHQHQPYPQIIQQQQQQPQYQYQCQNQPAAIPPPSYDSIDPPAQQTTTTTSVQAGPPADSRTVPDFDELTRRFEALKNGRKN